MLLLNIDNQQCHPAVSVAAGHFNPNPPVSSQFSRQMRMVLCVLMREAKGGGLQQCVLLYDKLVVCTVLAGCLLRIRSCSCSNAVSNPATDHPAATSVRWCMNTCRGTHPQQLCMSHGCYAEFLCVVVVLFWRDLHAHCIPSSCIRGNLAWSEV